MVSITTDAQNFDPSLRTRQPSASYLPFSHVARSTHSRQLRLDILLSVEGAEVSSDYFVAGIAFDALSPGISGCYQTGWVELKDRVISNALDQPPITSFAFDQGLMSALPFRDITRYFSKPIVFPCWSRTASITTDAQKRLPSITHTPAFRFKASSFPRHPQRLLRYASL